jgi:hypothetical protein
MFQIIRTIMSPKNRCDASKAPDREILVVSEDVPPQAGEIDEQHQQLENATVRAECRQQEADAVAA